MSLTPQPHAEELEAEPASLAVPRWMVAVLVVLVLLVAYVAFAQRQTRTELAAKLQEASANVSKLEARAARLEDSYAELKGQLEVTGERLGLTQSELARARSLAQQTREDQRKTAAQLGSQLEEQKTELGALSGTVGEVKTDVASTRQQLEQTQSKLERTIGDLGVQSGLIARNSDELQELKRRGERDYFEFDIRKSKEFRKVGSISLRLNKSDTKRQKYTVTVLANDKEIQKKDKTLLEPVQFYLQGTRHLLEIVVYTVDKDRVVGYLSVPKDAGAR